MYTYFDQEGDMDFEHGLTLVNLAEDGPGNSDEPPDWPYPDNDEEMGEFIDGEWEYDFNNSPEGSGFYEELEREIDIAIQRSEREEEDGR